MKKLGTLLLTFLITLNILSQSSKKAKIILDDVSIKMGAYDNMVLEFSQTLVNEDAGIKEGDELPIIGSIALQKEKYNLDYQGNKLIFDGQKMYVINNDEKEVTVSDDDMDGDDGFIYPSKLLTFYKEGYTYELGEIKVFNGRKTQFINLYPMDSESNISKVQLVIEIRTKHIYQLIQIGKNTSKTTFTITSFKSNQKLSNKLFSFDPEIYSERNGYIID